MSTEHIYRLSLDCSFLWLMREKDLLLALGRSALEHAVQTTRPFTATQLVWCGKRQHETCMRQFRIRLAEPPVAKARSLLPVSRLNS